MTRLAGKTALITGGSTGIGFATAQLFAAEGGRVYITGRRADKLAEAARRIGPGVVAVQGDVASLPDLARLFAQIRQEAGQLDIVFANAGIAEFAPLGKITEQQYNKLFDANVKGMLFTVQGALPLLPDGASVILMSSVVGTMGLGNNSVYAATKAAARSFVRVWATDLKARHIRVNAISPGMTETEGLRELLGDSDAGKQRKDNSIAAIPLGRVGTPQDVAKGVLYLASDDSAYVTGTELFVDGGFAQV